jgi:hypothetical protein
MASIKVRFYVPELTNVMLGLPTEGYDQVKVYRSDSEDVDDTYSEITGVGTRIDLVVDETNYEYIDGVAPTPLYWYKTAYFNSTTSAESALSDVIQGTDPGLIVSLQDIRAEGVPDTELSDERALILSYGWQKWFEHMTGRWFTPKEMTLTLDGDGSRVMWLDVPIITLDELYINDDFVNAVATDDYVVYARTYPDDRRNPRIKLKRKSGSIYEWNTERKFLVGDQNQRIVGTFGYVEPDGSAPFLVQRAIMTLVLATAELKGDSEIDQLAVGRKIEEVTDRHRVRYSDLWDEIVAWKPTGFTEVDEAIRLYRKPAYIGMARAM